MSSNSELTANSISVVNSLANSDMIIVVRNHTANNWGLKGVIANTLGISANIAVGGNTLIIVNGLVVSIT